MDFLGFYILAFTALFTMMNPFSVMPVYISYCEDDGTKAGVTLAWKACLTAFLLMCFFSISGKFVFNYFNLSLDSLKVVGGVLFFINGYDMLQAKPPRTKSSSEKIKDFHDDVAITPLGIPLLCGPGTITVIILMTQKSLEQGFTAQLALFAAMFSTVFLSFILLISSKKVMDLIGESGNKVMFRIMGLILMMIAVEYFFSGIRPLLGITL